MERIYYPSIHRVVFFNYLLLPIVWLLGFWARTIIDSIHDIPPAHLNWDTYITLCVSIIGFNVFIHGIRGQKSAIKISSSTITGPIAVGRDESIPLNMIDFEKARKKKQIYSTRGDRIRFDKWLFEPKDVSEIWEAVFKFDKKNE